MKQRRQRNIWRSSASRPRKRERASVYPLSHARRSYSAAAGASSTAVRSLPRDRIGAPRPLHEPTIAQRIPPAGQRTATRGTSLPRGVKAIAWSILILFPLTVAVWAATIILPIAIEARQAAGEIFVTPVPREHFVTPVAVVPTAPGATHTPAPSPTSAAPDATPTAAPPTNTLETGVPSPTPTEVVPTATPYPPWDGTQPIHILLLGVDRRVSDGDGPARSDTMIVVRVDPVSKRVDMVSIPRDLLVEIPGYYATKANAAYPFGEADSSILGGGPTLAAQMVEYNFGIYIDYFAEVDIAGMERVIDILGGIVIDVPNIVKDDQYPTDDYGYTRIYFSPGLQRMDGVTAVRYSRTRHDDGDFARQDRQHEVLRAIRHRVDEIGVITRLPEIISEVGDSVRTDLSLRQVLSLAQLGQGIGEDDIHSHSLLPYLSESWIDEGYYLVGDWTAIRALFAELASNPNVTSEADPTPTAEIAP